jgi:DNA gyrase subunit A
VTDQHELLIVTEQGQIIRMPASGLRPIGRDTQGVRLIDLADGDRVVSIATLMEPEVNGVAESEPDVPDNGDAE